MEADGQQLWKLLRPTVRATGPLKVLRRMGPDRYLYDGIPQVVERWGAQRVLKRLSVDDKPVDLAGAAWEALADLATARKRLRLSREAGDRVALDLLDACARLPEDNPGARLAGGVVEAIGTKVASMEFDSGVPGSGQVLRAWRVGKQIFLTGDETDAFAVYRTLDAVLRWWVREWDLADIQCRGVKTSAIKALGLVRDEDESGDAWIRINGRVWTRRTRAKSREGARTSRRIADVRGDS